MLPPPSPPCRPRDALTCSISPLSPTGPASGLRQIFGTLCYSNLDLATWRAELNGPPVDNQHALIEELSAVGSAPGVALLYSALLHGSDHASSLIMLSSKPGEHAVEYVGGCQCGRIRYRAVGPRDRSSVCYCRMCQKASGGAVMAFVRFPAHQVHWPKLPDTFASSNLVERGFCRDCGTPLSYRQVRGSNISLTINSLDDPEAVRPELRFFPQTEVSWCTSLSTVPTKEMDMEGFAGIVNYQHVARPPNQ
jgi:hypothetical protein